MYSIPLAYLLWLISGFGALGFHRFYLGKILSGLIYIPTGGLFGIGCVYDFITLPFQVIEANQRTLRSRQARYETRADQGSQGPQGERPVGPGAHRYSQRHTDNGYDPQTAAAPETPEKVILKTARHNRGLASPSEIALEADMELDKAKEELENLANKGYCELRVKKTGAMTYYFPDFADHRTPEELEPF